MKRNKSFFNLLHRVASLFLAVNFFLTPTLQALSPTSDNSTLERPAESGTATVSVNTPVGPVMIGESFPVQIAIDSLTTPLSGFQFDLTYDPNLVSPTAVGQGAFLPMNGRNVVCPNATTPTLGTLRFACASSGAEAGPVGAGELATLTFVALTPGISPLTLGDVLLAGPGTPPVAVTPTPISSQVSVIPQAGVAVSPGQTLAGLPGMTVTHVFTVTNAGDYTDTFSLQVDDFTWPATLPVATTGPVGSGRAVPVQVNVDIPLLFGGGTVIGSDTFTLTVTSGWDSAINTTTTATTEAIVDTGVLLGNDQTGSGDIMTQVAYSVGLTNTGNYTDSFNLSAASGWVTTVSPETTNPIPAGASIQFSVIVDVPDVPDGSQDVVTVTAESGWNSAVTDDMRITTTAIRPEEGDAVFMPVVLSAETTNSAIQPSEGLVETPQNSADINNNPVNLPMIPPGPDTGITSLAYRFSASSLLNGGCYSADFDCDQDVDEADLVLQAAYWNCASGDGCFDAVYDLDLNGVVDVFDLAWTGNDYDVNPPQVSISSPPPGAVVPEGDLLVTGFVTDTHTVISVTVNEIPATIGGNAYMALVPLSAGNQALHVVAIDEVGQVNIAGRVVGVDGEGPEIQVQEPSHRQSVYTQNPLVDIAFNDYYSAVDPASLSVTLTDENSMISDITGDLTVTTENAQGVVTSVLDEGMAYTMTVSLADVAGNVSVVKTTFFVPADPGTIEPPQEPVGAGWVSGIIYDSATCDAHLTTCQGLSGVEVTLAAVDTNALSQLRAGRDRQLAAETLVEPMSPNTLLTVTTEVSGTIVTGPDGFFSFPVGETGLYWLRAENEGYTYGQREAEIVLERSTAANAIYLTPLDSAMTMCDNSGCNHTSSDGTMELDIPAGAIPPGESVEVSATNFEQVEFLPSGELPEGTWETYAYNLGGASEVTFTQPVTVRIANDIGFAPGTPIPLGYWNQVTQQWEHAGTGIVDPTGQWVVMQVTHFSNYDCNDPLADPQLGTGVGGDGSGDPGPGDKKPDDCNGEGACFVHYQSGTFEEWVDLPSVTVLGEQVAPQLRYNSDRAVPSEVIDIRLSIEDSNGATLGDYIEWELYIEGEKTDSFTFAANLDSNGEVGRYRYYWDGRNAQGDLLPPGVYNYSVRMRIPFLGEYCYALGGIFGNPPDCVNGATGIIVDAMEDVWVQGTVTLIGDVNSPFGTGWALVGQQRLYEDEAGQVLIDEGDVNPVEYYFPGKDLLLSGTTSATLGFEGNQPGFYPNGWHPPLALPELNKGQPESKPADNGRPDILERPINSSSPVSATTEASEPEGEDLVQGIDLNDIYLEPVVYQRIPVSEPSSASIPEAVQTAENDSLNNIVPTFMTNVSGTINTNTTWTATGSPYVIDGNLTIASGVVLTIEAGVVVKFKSNYSLNVQGQLLAQGTAGNEVYFTSIHDDSVGGDTNGNGNATTPAKGDWYYILLNSSSSQVHLDYAVVQYSGASSGSIYSWYSNPILSMNNSTISNSDTRGISFTGGGTVTVTNSTIENNDYEGIYVAGSSGNLNISGSSINNNGRDGIGAVSNVIITGSVISGNLESGIELRPAGAVLSATISDNTIINNIDDAIYVYYNNGAGLPILSNNTLNGNGLDNGIGLGGTIGISMTLPMSYPLTYVSRDLNVDLNASLTISAGAVIKFDNSDNLTVQGQLLAQGTAGNKIYFTSIHDDSVGGDTNGNGNATTPIKGDWQYILLNSNSSQVHLAHAVVRYGGSSSGSIYSWYAYPILSVSNSTISNSDTRGISLTGGGTVTVTNSTIEDNDYEGIYVTSSDASLSVSGSSITTNGQNGIETGSNVIVTGSVISGNLESGIELRPTSVVLSATISDNTITNNFEDAIYVYYNNGAGLPVLSNNTLSGNGLDNGIGLGGTIGISTTLPAGYPLTFVSRDLMIGSSTVLTISAGAVIKFDQFDSLNVQGQLLAQGTPSNEIYFTSIHDDSVGGDTNGNGNATTPANGDWYYILLSSNSSQVHLDHVVVRYGGSSAGSIYSWNTNLTLSVSNSIIDNSENSGIFLGGGGTVTVTNSSIENNDDEGIYVSGSSGSLLVIGSSINNNGRDGIEAGNNVVVTDSIISGNVESGIELRPTGAVLSATISDNTITNNSGDAIYVNYNNGAGLPVLSSNTISGNGLDNGIGLGGTVGISATLPGGYPLTYVSRDLNVSLNSTLTISAGAVIKFDLYDSLNVQGQLLARGAPGNEIFFTSLHDDSVGGDTNGNGNATAPAKGDWYYIQLSSNSSRVNLDYAVVRYGGSFGGGIYSGYSDPILSVSNSAISDSDSRGLYLTGGGTVTVTNSTVENNDDEGIYVASSAASLFVTGSSINNNGRDGIGAGSNVIATSNVISGNLESGIELRPTNAVLSATINDNTITNNIEDAIYVNYNGGAGLPVLSNNTLSGNGLDNGIGLGGSLGISMTLPASYYLTFVSRDLTINSNTTLTMEPGTVLKFDAGGSLRVYGILLAQTTPGNEIYFTSIHDDSVGGDTNSNGNATSPVKGDWSRIWLFDDDSRAFFDNVVLRYGGSGSYGVLTIWFNDGKISFNNSLLNDSDSEGIDASNGGTITITNSTIENSDYSGVSTSNATVIISDSVIQNNGYNGVQVYGSGTLSLTNSTISNNGQDGVELGHSAVIATNTISNNGESGIEIRPNTFISPTISDNIITNNTEDALTVNYNLGAGLPILNNNTISGNGLDNGIGLEGTMDISMTLPVSYPLTFVGRNLTVDDNATLTFEPGSGIKIDDNKYLYVSGELVAEGTAGNEVYFTSIHDDSLGGDTNGNGNATTPTAGDWQYIWLNNDTRSSFDHAVIRYGGDSFASVQSWYSDSLISINNSLITESDTHGLSAFNGGTLTVTNSTIENSLYDGINLNNATMTLANSIVQNNGQAGLNLFNSLVTLTNNSVQGNTYPIQLHPDNQIPDLTGNSMTGNSVDAIAMSFGTMVISRTWDVQPLPYLIIGDLDVAVGTELTISPGNDILFDISTSLFVNGTLLAIGTETQPIRFTSADPFPTPYDWHGVYLGPESDASILAHCEISYGGVGQIWNGRWYYSNLVFHQSDAQVLGCEIHNSGQNGVQSFDSAPILVEMDIHDNQWRGLYVEGSNTPIINQSGIYSNTNYGIQNITGLLMEARYNWWGDPSGPLHPTVNPTGLGNDVSDDVDFIPWLEEPEFNLAIGANRTATDYTTLFYNADSNTYTRHYLDGTQVRFDTEGRHDYTLAPDGRKTTYTYNPDGSVATMNIIPPGETDPRWTWTFGYSNGRLSTITDPANRITYFTVDAQNNLVAATLPDGAGQAFTYDAQHLMTNHTDQNGDVTTQVYDSYGRITTITEPPRAVYDQNTGQVNVVQEVRTFNPSETSYPLINDSIIGTPDNPAPAVPTSTILIDFIDYGRGGRSGFTNKWGAWLQETDGEGRTTIYERDGANNITHMQYPDGDCVDYSYNTNGLVIAEDRMEAGQCGLPLDARNQAAVQRWSYTYESEFNRVKTETDPMGNTTTYVYDYEEGLGNAGKLIRIEYPPVPDEFGQLVTPTVSYTYNNWGLLETETDARGMVTKYVYSQGTPDEASGGANPIFAPGVTPVPGLLTQIIEDFGGENLTHIYRDFDGVGNALTTIGPDGHETTTYTFDNMNRVLSQTDAVGIVTTYQYDGQGNLVHQVADYTPDGVSGRNVVTEYTYNPNDMILTERTSDGGLVVQNSYTYDINRQVAVQTDGRGNETLFHYDEADQLASVIDPAGHVISYTYGLDGRLETVTDADDYVTRYYYDEFNRLQTEIQDEGGLNLTRSYAYDLNDNLTTVTDTIGLVTCYEYDSHNRRTAEILDCTGLGLTTTYAFDINGNVRYVTDERGIATYYDYDALNRLTLIRLDDGGLNLTTGYAYDPAGNLFQETDERGIVIESTYDALNRLISQCRDRFGLNLCTTYTYDGLNNQDTVTDPNLVTTRTDYNGFGLPVRVIEDDGGLAATTSYYYDSALNLVSLMDANGNQTQYTYDERNLLASEIYADGTVVRYIYDGRGNVAVRTNQDDDTTTHTYDGDGRLVQKTFSTGGWQDFDYDDEGRMTRAEESMNGHNSLLQYGYNPLGDVISTTQTLDGNSWPVGYSYDYVGGVYTVTYPSGAERVQMLDPIGRLDTVSEGDGSPVADYEYHDLDSYFTLAYPNGLTNRSDYDPLYRTTRVNSAVADYRYGYDAAGNRTYMQRWHQPGNPADVYEYDNLYQLTQVWYGADATDPGSISSYDKLQWYDLDNLGNRLEVQNDGVSQNYQPNNGQQLTNPMNRYEQVDSSPFTYDLQGNTLSDENNSYTYDILNRQITMSGPGGSAEYIYDALDRRIAKTVGGITTTHFIYDKNYRVIEERAGDGSLAARYTYGAGIDEPLTMERDGNTYYYHRDALGSVTEMTDVAGLLVERYEYDVYGEPQIYDGSNNPLPVSALENAYLFTGRRYDEESGNYYYRARMYGPGIGRFLQMDPLGFIDGMNLYAFVTNNPINWGDPYGLDKSTCDQYNKSNCGKNDDPYPEQAYKCCRAFYDKYNNSEKVDCVGRCLVRWEQECASYTDSSARGRCRLKAHLQCYLGCGFIPWDGIPEECDWRILWPF